MSRGYTEHDKYRIASIAATLLAGMVRAKEVNPDDRVAMEKATRRCVRDAAQVYTAALEYVGG